MGDACKRKGARGGLAVGIDINGVLTNGPFAIEGARAALEMLREHNVPFLLLTNAGGSLKYKQRQVNDIVFDGAEFLAKEEIVLAHTPFEELHHLKNKRVLVTGYGDNVKVM